MASIPPEILLHLLVAHQNAIVHSGFRDEIFHCVGSFFIEGDSNHSQASFLVLALQLVESRYFRTTGAAPRCPKIQYHYLSLESSELTELPSRS